MRYIGHFLATAGLVVLLSARGSVASESDRATADAGRATDTPLGRHPIPTAIWVFAQFVPSPELLVARDGAAPGLRWQVTPILYSFGIHRGLSPWRFVIAEPNVRQSGSIEIYGSPEYLALPSADEGWGLRVGSRAYFPVVQRGEYVSVSLGGSYLRFDHSDSMAFEVGAYVLFGVLGVQLAYSPTFAGGSSLATLRIRYF